MKRTLVLLGASLVLGMLGTFDTHGFVQPKRAPLPDYDARLAGRPAAPAPPAEALKDLHARVPDLQVGMDRILGAPQSFSSRAGFLTGPGGEGLAVRSTFLQMFPAADNHRVIKAFLSEHAGLLGYGAEALTDAIVTRDYVTEHNGLRTTVWQQQVDGIPVFGTILMGHITRQGELVNLTTLFLPSPTQAADAGLRNRAAVQAAPPVSAAQAIALAAGNIGEAGLSLDQVTAQGAPEGAEQHQKFTAGPALRGQTDVRLVWLPLNSSSMRLCWEIILTSGSRLEMYDTLVDAETGDVLLRHSQNRYISNASYRVYTLESPSPFSPGPPTPITNQPPVVPRVLIVTNAYNTNASPLGWINDADNSTTGNNATIGADRDGNLQPDQPLPQGTPNRVFDFAQDLLQDPTNYTASSVVQLFYNVNKFHDFLYGIGFTEAAGNMQATNFGRGGLQGDAVTGVCQVYGQYNNAFMQVTRDGVVPLMASFLFDGPTPMRDSALDTDVMLHEYTHSVTERTLGGGVGVNYFGQSGGIHEGNSDWFAIAFQTEAKDNINGTYPSGGYVTLDIIPGYMVNYYFGIRRYPYCTDMTKNPLTYKDIDPYQALPHTGVPLSPLFTPFDPTGADEVHNAGEVWCVTLWDVRAKLVQKYGWTNGNTLAMQTVLDGERLSVPSPNFLQLRDAILQADMVDNGGANQNEIWAAFAKRGMGGSATSPDSTTCIGVVEAFDLPGVAVVTAYPDDSITGNANGTIDPNECVDISVLLRNGSLGPASNIVATLATTNPHVTVVQAASAYPPLTPGAAAFNSVPFRIYTQPSLPCGSSISFALRINSSGDLRTNYFLMPSGYLSLKPNRITNSTSLNIPDAQQDPRTNGVDSIINVSGVYDPIGKVTVSLHVIHPMVGDLQVELISPDGTRVKLAQNRGGLSADFGTDCTGGWTTFDDAAATAISAGTAPFVGSFRPEEPLSTFGGKSGTSVNGAWRLHLADTIAQITGSLQCWVLSLNGTVCDEGGGGCAGDLAVEAMAAPEPVVVGSNLVYTVTVTNNRALSSLGAVLTDVLPTNAVFVTAAVSQGTYTNRNGTLVFNLGAVTNGAAVEATVVLTPLQTGLLTNTFVVSSLNGDLDPSNNRAVVTSTVINPAPYLVAAGTDLASESVAPPDHSIEPGETVTVNFSLLNVGSLDTASLVATLQPGNGVTAPSGPQSYGTVPAFGQQSVSRPFTFTAQGAPGSVITATLLLQDNSGSLGSVSFSFTLSGSGTFGNGSSITINDYAPATPYPSVINVSNLVGAVNKVTVKLSKFAHTFPHDVNVLLAGPSGPPVLLMSHVGAGFSVTNLVLTFDQAAAASLPGNAALTSGTYQPTALAPSAALPAPAPSAPYAATLDALRGGTPNGAWRLFVQDDTPSDQGVILGGWSLTVNTVSLVGPNADLAVTLAGAPASVVVGTPVTYTATVTNLGLSQATGVVLNNTLPPGLDILQATATQGTVTTNTGLVVVNVGSLPAGAGAAVVIVARPGTTGSKTVSATAAANEYDLNPLDNTASVVTTVANATADLAVQMTGTPNPAVLGGTLTYNLTVTNLGPYAAADVWVTNTLSSGDLAVSASPSQGTNFLAAGGRAICWLGPLPAAGSASITVTATAMSLGSHVARADVVSSTPDPAAANNRAYATNSVVSPSPAVVAAGVALVQEFGVVNGAIEPGERVTLSLALRNSGTADTSNLRATLQAASGVELSDGPQVQTYGALVAGGASVAQPFTFTASSTFGDTITAVLALQDGATSLGAVSFNLPLSILRTVTSSGGLIIKDNAAAVPYPSTIVVTNLTQAITKVTVTVNGFAHGFPSDVKMLLVGPSGQNVEVMGAAGDGNGVSGLTLTFDDDASASLPQSSALTSGSFKPTSYDSSGYPAPAPSSPFGSALMAFSGSVPNGTWSLYVQDTSTGDSGSVGSWALNFITTRPLQGSADLAVSSSLNPRPVHAGDRVTLTVNAVNYGPSDATGVVLTNVLPGSFYVVSAVPSKGELTRAGSLVTCNVGALTNGETFQLTVVGNPTDAGTLNNLAGLAGADPDANPLNNLTTLAVSVAPPLLEVDMLGQTIVLSWPNLASGYVLQKSAGLSGAGWQDDLSQVTNLGGRNYVYYNALDISASPNLFFRLLKR